MGAPVPMSGRLPMPRLQTNLALHIRPGPACWVALHERDPVRDHTQRRRAVQRAPRASCSRRGAGGAHLSFRYASKRSLLLHINQDYGPLQT